MLTKRRNSPFSSSSRSLIPGWRRSRSSRTERIESPSAGTSSMPAVNLRSGVGTRTLTGIALRIPPVANSYRCLCLRRRRWQVGLKALKTPARRLKRRLSRSRERPPRSVETFEERVELLEPGFDQERLLDLIRHRLQSLVAVSGNRNHDAFVGIDSLLRNQLHRDGERSAAGGLGEDAFGAREQLDGVD